MLFEDENDGERGPPVPPQVINVSSDSETDLQWSPLSQQDVLVSKSCVYSNNNNNNNNRRISESIAVCR